MLVCYISDFKIRILYASLHPGHPSVWDMKYTKPLYYSRVVAADGVATTGTGRAAAADGGVDRAAQVEALARAARRELGDDLFFPFRARLRQREVVQWPEGRPEGLVFLGLHLIRHMHGAEHDVQLD